MVRVFRSHHVAMSCLGLDAQYVFLEGTPPRACRHGPTPTPSPPLMSPRHSFLFVVVVIVLLVQLTRRVVHPALERRWGLRVTRHVMQHPSLVVLADGSHPNHEVGSEVLPVAGQGALGRLPGGVLKVDEVAAFLAEEPVVKNFTAAAEVFENRTGLGRAEPVDGDPVVGIEGRWEAKGHRDGPVRVEGRWVEFVGEGAGGRSRGLGAGGGGGQATAAADIAARGSTVAGQDVRGRGGATVGTVLGRGGGGEEGGEPGPRFSSTADNMGSIWFIVHTQTIFHVYICA